MKYEANVPEHFGNSFWTNVKTRWNYNDNSTWIKLIGVTDKQWNGTFTEIDGLYQTKLILVTPPWPVVTSEWLKVASNYEPMTEK